MSGRSTSPGRLQLAIIMHMPLQSSRSSPQAPSSLYGLSQPSLGRRLFASLTSIYTRPLASTLFRFFPLYHSLPVPSATSDADFSQGQVQADAPMTDISFNDDL